MSKRVLGIFGALIGGFLFALPWILIYIYGNMIFSILAAVIAYGALLGYKKVVGQPDKTAPIIITIISLLVVVISTLLIIPCCLLYKEGFTVNLDKLQMLYQNSEFSSAIICDLIVSVFFTFLGISTVISKLKMEVDPVYADKVNNVNKLKLDNQKNVEEVKKAFMTYHAMDKYSATSKENILREIDNNELIFKNLKLQQIIKKVNGNYYFSEKAEKSLFYRFVILYLKIMGVIFLIVTVIILLFLLIR